MNRRTSPSNGEIGRNLIFRVAYLSNFLIDNFDAVDRVEQEVADREKIDVKRIHLLSFQLLRTIHDKKEEPTDINITAL